VEVLAGPVECTAIGNIMMQAKATGLVKDRWDMRRLIADNYKPRRFQPTANSKAWDEAFERYKAITKQQ